MNSCPNPWTPERIFQPRPGGRPVVSPEGLVYCTDGKCRWVGQPAQPRFPRLLAPLLSRLVSTSRCVLYILDSQSVSAQRVKGKADRDRVFALISQWTGGQSYPSLRFDPPVCRQMSFVTDITPQSNRGRIRLDGGQGRLDLYAGVEQLDAVRALLDHVLQTCQQA